MPAQYRVLVPKTRFPVRTNPVTHEPAIQKAAKFDDLYGWQERQQRGDDKIFTLHDGPPYANGAPHMGHVLNRVLKDVINRYKLMRGYKLAFRPGWDCHGLPIELKACRSDDLQSPLEIRAKAEKYARKTVALQKEAFQRWGCLADWNNPYLTMDPEYEAAQIDVFHQMYKRGCIYRGYKPVYWSPSSRTALAEAELEYRDHVSQAVYILFPLTSEISSLLPEADRNQTLWALVWTTTPWTLVANQAVSYHSNHSYCVVRMRHTDGRDRLVLLGEKNVNRLAPILGEFEVVSTLSGSQLANLTYAHPISPQRQQMRFVHGEHVDEEEGTGLVHTAPTHGFEDHEIGVEAGLDMTCVVDGNGCYTAEAPSHLVGLRVLSEGNEAVIEGLQSSKVLLKRESYTHRYPYDWRTKKPVIIRSTKQWFASVKQLKEEAKAALRGVTVHPRSSGNQLPKMLDARGDWCISRQRVWGVPLPIFYHVTTDEPLLTEETVVHAREMIRAKGSNCWWELPLDKLLPPSFSGQTEDWRRGEDTMDVWFDSGSSWAAVLSDSGTDSGQCGRVADMYLEGVDQHRGWFQSSLLTSVAIQNQAPYRRLVTHGFVLDGSGAKMSKSIGNVVSPSDIIDGKKFGVEAMRWWVASSSFTSHVSVSDEILQQSSDFVQRLRNLFRFMLGNLSDFNPTLDLVPHNAMSALDQYMLHILSNYCQEATGAYESLNFSRLSLLLVTLVPLDLSAFYCNIVKDSLYCDPARGRVRLGTLSAIHHLLLGLVKSVAPVLPHLAEEVVLHHDFPGGILYTCCNALHPPVHILATRASFNSIMARSTILHKHEPLPLLLL